jgi:hypothetical protein
MKEYPASLHPESLMTHMRAICQGIGPRPSTSPQEKQAADYVEKTARGLGITNIERQDFKSPNSAGWVEIPCFAAGLLAAILAIFGGMWGKLLGSLFFLGSTITFLQFLFVIPPFFHRWIARWNSQNVIVKIPAANRPKQTLYLVGHLDSQKQRFQFPPSPYWIMKAQTSLPIVAGILGGLFLLVEDALNLQTSSLWLWLLAGAYLYGLLGAIYDETQPYVDGANDNATAVSLLLGAAQALKAQPLQHTDVILLYTGCEEVGCVGMESYLQHFAFSAEHTFWIDIEMVGTGNLCYVTKHGISYFSAYTPHSQMVELAGRVAEKNPNLRVQGKNMVIIEEIANLWRRKYNAICLAGYNAQGVLPNWHRLSDTLDNIEPDTLSRAAIFTWELMQEIDQPV